MKSLNYIKNYLKYFPGDLLGGLTSGIIAIPLALAFGVASGMGALAGLYGAIFVCFIAAIFGGALTQISGPTGPMTVIVAAAIAMGPQYKEGIFLIIIMAGIFQVLLSFSRMAGVVKYVPYPVISGFMSGIGVIIIILESNPLLGADVIGSPIKTIMNYPSIIEQFNILSLFLGVITLLIVFFTPQKVNRIIPSSLIALILVTLLSVLLNLDVPRIGEIPTALPHLVPLNISFDLVLSFIPIALTLAVIGAVDSLLTALVIDSLSKSKHNSDRVLFGQGLGNAIAGLFGGVVGAGATMRTVVNIRSGGKTRISAIVHALFLLIILLWASPLVKVIPMAVLAGILIKVGSSIIDLKFIKVIKFAPKHDLYVMLLVFVLTVFYDLIFAVGAGITLSAMLFSKRMADETDINVKEIMDPEIMRMEGEVEHVSHHKIRIVHVSGNFFFGSVTRIVSEVDELLGTKYLILNFESISHMDISAIFALEEIIVKLYSQKIKVMLVINNKDLHLQLNDLKIFDQVGLHHVFCDELDAIERAKEYLKRKFNIEDT